MKVDQDYKEQKYVQKAIVFAALAVALSFVCVVGALLDAQFGADFVSVLCKLLIIAGILAYARYKKECRRLWEGKFLTPFLVLAFVPCVIFSLSVIGTPDSLPSASVVLLAVLNIATTAVWEELFFRYVGKSLFGKNGSFTYPDFILLTTVFAAVHLVNMLFYSPVSVLLQTAEAAAAGIFWLALYSKTRNLMVTVTSHFALNAVAGLIPLFVARSENRFFDGLEILPVVAVMVFCLSSGSYILIRNGILKSKKQCVLEASPLHEFTESEEHHDDQ